MILLIVCLMMQGCQNEEEEQIEGFEAYCANFCEAVGMQMDENTGVEEHTLNCVCQKIFLKKEWEERK